MRVFGLIGYPLTHSFSKGYFSKKFESEKIFDARYDNFEIDTIERLPGVLQTEGLIGLNVTIPYKQAVLPYLHGLDVSAQEVGAVNVVKVLDGGRLVGYNSDFYGFKESLLRFVHNTQALRGALILGTGGAAKAVEAALRSLDIRIVYISRTASEEKDIRSYSSIDKDVLEEYNLVVNTTPLGMYPKVETFPPLPYDLLHQDSYLFDLVYNPEETMFMKLGRERGAKTKNGLEMLHLQAEKAWEIWNASL